MTVGLRSAYICTTLATKIMMNNSKSGLIVNVASSGGMRYLRHFLSIMTVT